jgi:hypothetical protein
LLCLASSANAERLRLRSGRSPKKEKRADGRPDRF